MYHITRGRLDQVADLMIVLAVLIALLVVSRIWIAIVHHGLANSIVVATHGDLADATGLTELRDGHIVWVWILPKVTLKHEQANRSDDVVVGAVHGIAHELTCSPTVAQ